MTFKGYIEHGSYPAPSYLATQSTFNNAQTLPIDGTVVQILTNTGTDFSLAPWSSSSYTINDLSTSIGYLSTRRSLGWGRLRYNYALVKLGASGAVTDWFGAVEAFISKMLLAGRFASDAGLQGLFLDVESYNHTLWTYTGQLQRLTHSLQDYQAQVRNVGRAVGTGIREYNKDLNIFLTDCYYAYGEEVGGGVAVAAAEWGLYKDFLDGLYDAYGDTLYRSGGTALGKIIATTEASYGCKTLGCITYGVNRVNGSQGALYRGSSSYFGTVDEYGLALQVDKTPFDPATPGTNYFTAAELKTSLGLIADSCTWGWLYNDTYKFYNNSNLISSTYLDKIREFRVERGLY